MDKNGYFLFTIKEDGTYIRIFPKEGNGKAVTREIIMRFLDTVKFNDYNVITLTSNVMEVDEEYSFKLSDVRMNSSTAFCDYKVSPNRMMVTLEMFPPVGQGSEMTFDEMKRDLAAKKICYGVKEELLQQIADSKCYNTVFVIAKGSEPTDGTDARIEYQFNTAHVATPKMNDDGTVNYYELDMISRVEAGKPVAIMIPENPGVPGKDVFGADIPPKRVAKKNFKYGRNMYISEDGLQLISKVSGHVTLEDNKIFVSDTYEVPVDLDVTTGNIDYDGNVLVKGNVRSGFSLKASGDITVMGVVEGAILEAGGKIVINRGVQGMNKAELRSGSDIVSKFIENATVVCGGDIEIDALMHSSISAKGNVRAKGKNGLIVGGTVRAGVNVSAKQIGNEMGTVTNVYVGVDPSLRKRVNELTEIIKNSTEEKEKLNQAIAHLRKKQETGEKLDSVKQELLQKSVRRLILLEQSLKADTTEYKEGQQLLTENQDARIKVSGSIYPGAKLSFGNTVYFIKDRKDYCQFVKRDGDVMSFSL